MTDILIRIAVVGAISLLAVALMVAGALWMLAVEER